MEERERLVRKEEWQQVRRGRNEDEEKEEER